MRNPGEVEIENLKPIDVIKKISTTMGSEQPLYVVDLADVLRKYKVWTSKLPRIQPFYAVKCNPDPMVIRLMVSLGMGFDCASKCEIDAVLSAGCETSKIIYAHTIKNPEFIQYASKVGVDLMTFDSEDELKKIKRTFPNARLVMRFRVRNKKSEFPLDHKFGCHLEECEGLLKTAKRLGLNVVGTSFHVGSLCTDSEVYYRAIQMSREVFDVAKNLGFDFNILDIGGGFPGHDESYEEFDSHCTEINRALDTYFSDEDGLKIIAEPGCYFVGSAFTLCTTIIGRKETRSDDADSTSLQMEYYLNEGRYSSFFVGIEKYAFRVKPHFNSEAAEDRPVLPSKLWGWTCCGVDHIVDHCILPLMEQGEHLIFENMGAYTIPLCTSFNGFSMPKLLYTYSGEESQPLLKFVSDAAVLHPSGETEPAVVICNSDGVSCNGDTWAEKGNLSSAT